jgi:hypothetical protein
MNFNNLGENNLKNNVSNNDESTIYNELNFLESLLTQDNEFLNLLNHSQTYQFEKTSTFFNISPTNENINEIKDLNYVEEKNVESFFEEKNSFSNDDDDEKENYTEEEKVEIPEQSEKIEEVNNEKIIIEDVESNQEKEEEKKNFSETNLDSKNEFNKKTSKIEFNKKTFEFDISDNEKFRIIKKEIEEFWKTIFPNKGGEFIYLNNKSADLFKTSNLIAESNGLFYFEINTLKNKDRLKKIEEDFKKNEKKKIPKSIEPKKIFFYPVHFPSNDSINLPEGNYFIIQNFISLVKGKKKKKKKLKKKKLKKKKN